jgi:hypothetical protein
VGAFETEPRTAVQIEAWFPHAKAFVVVEDGRGAVVGYAVAHRTPTVAATSASASSRSTSAATSAAVASDAWR